MNEQPTNNKALKGGFEATQQTPSTNTQPNRGNTLAKEPGWERSATIFFLTITFILFAALVLLA